MNVKINVFWAVVSLVSFALGIGTLLGKVQQFIQFQSSLNEVVFCVLWLILGIFTTGASIEINKNNQKI